MRMSAELYEQILAALKSDAHGDKDKRREPRVGVAGEAAFVTIDEAGKRVAGTMRVRDVSRSGVGLLSNQEVAQKQRFVVQLPSGADSPIWLVCNTAYCRPIDRVTYSVGARIAQVLRAGDIEKVEAKAALTARKSTAHVSDKSALKAEERSATIARISKAILG